MAERRFAGITGRGVKFVDRDRGYRELIKLMRTPAHNVIVGVVGEDAATQHTEADMPIGDLAAIHEFGTATIPSRPFIRFGIDRGSRRYRKEVERIFATTNNRGQLGPKLVKFGRGIAEDIRNAVRNDQLNLARLSGLTVARKGHETPLVDSGELTAAISARVERR